MGKVNLRLYLRNCIREWRHMRDVDIARDFYDKIDGKEYEAAKGRLEYLRSVWDELDPELAGMQAELEFYKAMDKVDEERSE